MDLIFQQRNKTTATKWIDSCQLVIIMKTKQVGGGAFPYISGLGRASDTWGICTDTWMTRRNLTDERGRRFQKDEQQVANELLGLSSIEKGE